MAAVFISGVIIGLGGYAYLQQGHKVRDAGELRSATLPASIMARSNPSVATTNQAVAAKSSFNGVTRATNSALQEAPSNQVHYDTGAGNRSAHETMAQPERDAVLEPASDRTHHADVPKPQPAYETPPEMSDDEFLAQAASMLQSGDVAGARTAYKMVAGRGNVRGAFSLAQTYDPDFLASRRIRGSKPDPSLARRWYEKAAKLGDQQASTRLKELKELLDKSSASDVLRR